MGNPPNPTWDGDRMSAALRAPSKLGSAGRRFWNEVTKPPTLGAPGFTFRIDELVTLEAACRQMDLIAQMQDVLDDEGLMSIGSKGQPAAHPLLGQIREHRALLNQLLKSLGMADAATETGQRSAQARSAAQARWSRGAKAG